MLKVKNEAVLIEIEAILKRTESEARQKVSAHDFVGIFSEKDADLINAAIEEGCEQINADDWK